MKRLALTLIVLVSLTGCELIYFGLIADTKCGHSGKIGGEQAVRCNSNG
jgi:hypothetical protein